MVAVADTVNIVSKMIHISLSSTHTQSKKDEQEPVGEDLFSC